MKVSFGMGHSYANNARGNLVLVCDACGGIGGVRTRQCPHRVLIASRFTERQRMPLCTPPALCSACFHEQGATHGLHRNCAPTAAGLQAKEDSVQARLDSGEWHLMSATVSDRPGVLVVSFCTSGGISNGFVQLLVSEAYYDARRSCGGRTTRAPRRSIEKEVTMMTRSAEDTGEAVVFMVSQSSNTSYRRVLWRVSVADAKRICSDPRSKGRRSALFWATDNIDDPTVNRFVRDAGHQGSLLRELGVTVLDSFRMREQRGGGAAQ